MNEDLKNKLVQTLKEYAESLVEDKRDIITRLEIMNDIQNMFMIIDSYKELENTLKDFFKEKHKKEKWEGR